MGVQYGNLTLYGVKREELIECLKKINRDAYISPTINNFTTVYDDDCDSDTKNLVDLATYLSAELSCSVLAVYVYDGDILWYHLNRFGEMLDEYITNGGADWRVGKGLYDLPSNGQIKGGDTQKLCSAFDKKDAIEQVESILRESDNLAIVRHEELARSLGIYPGLVTALNYMGVNTGEFPEHWEDDYYPEEYDYYLPSVEEANSMLIKVGRDINYGSRSKQKLRCITFQGMWSKVFGR